MSRYVASRFILKQLIFPQNVFIEELHVRTRKRHFPLFWIVNEQSISLSKVASIKLNKGLFFSDVIIENSGGDYPIRIEGLSNGAARRFRHDLETRERGIVEGPADHLDCEGLDPKAGSKPQDGPVEVAPGVKVHGLRGD